MKSTRNQLSSGTTATKMNYSSMSASFVRSSARYKGLLKMTFIHARHTRVMLDDINKGLLSFSSLLNARDY